MEEEQQTEIILVVKQDSHVAGDPPDETLMCRSCKMAIAILKQQDLYRHITKLAIAVVDDPESEGMVLSRQYGFDKVPALVVCHPDIGLIVGTSMTEMVESLRAIAQG